MVNIEYFLVDALTNTLKIKVSQDSEDIRKAVLYHNNEYRNKEGMDISSLFSNHQEVVIPTSMIDDTHGLWIVEFSCEDGTKVLGRATDFSRYHECILGKILAIKIDGCNVVDGHDCNDCNGNLLYSHAILETLISAVDHGYYSEANLLMKQLDELCNDCKPVSNDCGCK